MSKSGIFQLMEDLGEALSSGHCVAMLGGGNPAHIPEVQQAFQRAMEDILANNQFSAMVGNYDPPQGNRAFIRWLSEYLNQHYGWQVSEKNIAITNGSQSSFTGLFNIVTADNAAQKKIHLPILPEYIGYSDIKVNNCPPLTATKPIIDTDLDDTFFYKYRVDFDELIVNPEQTGAFCLSRPTNPTGNLITDRELKKLDQLAQHHAIPLIVDSAYGVPFPSIVYDEATPLWNDNIILCLSLSKLGLPGTRTGIVIANESVIERIAEMSAIESLAPGSVGPTLMHALVKRQDLLSLCQTHITPFYQKRCQFAVDILRHELSDYPVKLHLPQGALFLWAWFKDLPITSDKLYQALKADGVLILSGHHFFPGLSAQEKSIAHWRHAHECIRISYAAPEQQLQQGLQRLSTLIKRVYDNDTVN